MRSYAKLLLGTAEAGDQAVCEVLDRLISSATVADIGSSGRVRLFRQLDQELQMVVHEHSEADGVHPALNELSIVERRVLLLSIVGGFGAVELAQITGLPVSEISQVLERVQEKGRASSRTGVLIIEDEPHMAELLSLLVQQTGHVVAGMARNRAEALELAKGQSFGLILADFDLGEETSGKSVVGSIRESLGFDVPTIYITAYPDRLNDADASERDGLVSKPFDIWRVREAIDRVLGIKASMNS